MIRMDGRADADKTVAGEWTLLESMFRRLITDAKALVQLNGDNFLEGVSELLIWYPLAEDEYYQLCEGEP